MKEKIRCGLCSFGMSGRVFHGPLIEAHSKFALSAVLERNDKQAILKYPGIMHYRVLEDLLNDPEIDLIIVNVPDHLHSKFCKAALIAGKDVIVEKPLTLTGVEGQELIDLANKLSRRLFVFQNRRWDSDFLTIQHILNSKKLGHVVDYEAHYDRYRPEPPTNTWKEDEQFGPGLLYNLGAHLIDQTLVLFGWPDAVFADIQILRKNSKIVDYFNLILVYPGLRAVLRSSYLVKYAPAKFIIHGTEGSFVKPGSDPQEERLNLGWKADHPEIGKEEKRDWGRLFTSNTSPEGEIIRSSVGNYLKFYDDVYKDLVKNSHNAVNGEEGLNVIKIIEAAMKSHQTGKTIKLKKQ